MPSDSTSSDPRDVGDRLRATIAALNRKLRAHSSASDLTRSQSAVLSLIERSGPSTTADLARAQGMRQQSMAAIVSALTDAGLVTGARDPVDGRKVVLDLTDAARQEIRLGRLARADWLAHALESALTEREIARVADAVELLSRVADEP